MVMLPREWPPLRREQSKLRQSLEATVHSLVFALVHTFVHVIVHGCLFGFVWSSVCYGIWACGNVFWLLHRWIFRLEQSCFHRRRTTAAAFASGGVRRAFESLRAQCHAAERACHSFAFQHFFRPEANVIKVVFAADCVIGTETLWGVLEEAGRADAGKRDSLVVFPDSIHCIGPRRHPLHDRIWGVKEEVARDTTTADKPRGGFVNLQRVDTDVRSATARYPAPLYNKHLTTVLPNFKPVPMQFARKDDDAMGEMVYVRCIVNSHDGCELALDWATWERASSAQTKNGDRGVVTHIRGIVGLSPGLASTTASTYVKSFTRAVVRQGFLCVVLNSRGMGCPLTKPRLLAGGSTSDLRYLLKHELCDSQLRSRMRELNCQLSDSDAAGSPFVPLFLVGFSLGANILCKFLGEEHDKVRESAPNVRAAFALCAPWDFHRVRRNMDKLESIIIYEGDLSNGLRHWLGSNSGFLANHAEEARLDLAAGAQVRTVGEFDERVMVPHYHFDSVQQYYSCAMCGPYLHRIRLPTFCLLTHNDPIIGVPDHEGWIETCRRNPFLSLVSCPSGGHLGFLNHVTSEWRGDDTVMEAIVLNVVNLLLKAVHNGSPMHGPFATDE